ncbi:hypothetical protein [Streptomyces chattanoogensis]|uniref:hypothetical protein n=1 Tax=Streptomyces chattanoogensis TaxID=66876 RepID=UPI0036961939
MDRGEHAPHDIALTKPHTAESAIQTALDATQLFGGAVYSTRTPGRLEHTDLTGNTPGSKSSNGSCPSALVFALPASFPAESNRVDVARPEENLGSI